MSNKISQALSERLTQLQPEKIIRIVIGASPLPPPTGRVTLQTVRPESEAHIEKICQEVSILGGEVISSNWLNHTIIVEAPAEIVRRLENLETIHEIDLPRRLVPETPNP